MMKKFLVLLMVLGMASQASALLRISVNGNPYPEDSQYTLMPSETLSLDIWTTTAITPGAGEGYWALVATALDAHISGGVVIPALPTAEPGVVIYDDAVGVGEIVGLGTQNGVWGGIGLTGLGTYAIGATVYDEILFHCERLSGDVVINLYRLDSPTWSVIEPPEDSVIIHQIPEPMTMALLGLGGLFLRRRK
jgi:hypothetical protein